MNATPVPLPGGGTGYPQSSVVRFNGGLWYATADAPGNPDEFPDLWDLLATSGGGVSSDIYRDTGIEAGGAAGSGGAQYAIENRNPGWPAHAGVYLDSTAITNLVQIDTTEGSFSEAVQGADKWGFYVTDDGTGSGTSHTLLEMGVDEDTKVPYFRIMGQDATGGGGGGGGVLASYKGDWQPAATLQAGYAPAGTIDFEGGYIPPFLRTQNLYGGYTSSDWGDGASGNQAALLFVASAGDLGFLELDLLDVSSVRLTLAWGLNTDGTGRILLDGTEIESVTGADNQNGSYLWHDVPAGPGQHTLRIEVTAGATDAQSVIALDQIDMLGTTPAGYTAGWNPGGPSSTSYTAGDLVRWGGDLWLARTDTDNSSSPADGGTWARLSTHDGSGGASPLPDPGADGNLLTAQSSAWVSAPLPADDMPSLVLLFENQLI